MADKQEHFFISRIEDLIRQALFTGTSVYTDFLTTKEYMLTEKTAASFLTFLFISGAEARTVTTLWLLLFLTNIKNFLLWILFLSAVLRLSQDI